MKDNFSAQSDRYARYRPTYPAALFEFINTQIPDRQNAWDCGTGNGQVAIELAKTFEQVMATDISRSQLDNAAQAANIRYSVQPAETTNFENSLFDLIVVAQAIHWFNFETFYAEVRRTARPDAVLCVTGYGNVKISEAIDPIIAHLYEDITGPYWDAERHYIDENYQTIPFPFTEIPAPAFTITSRWTLEHLTGYLNTWSGLRHFIRQKGYNPLEQLLPQLKQHWGNAQTMEITFPLLLRMGHVH